MRTPWTESGRRAAELMRSFSPAKPAGEHAAALIAEAEQEARIAAATAERQRLRAELMDFINDRLFGDGDAPAQAPIRADDALDFHRAMTEAEREDRP